MSQDKAYSRKLLNYRWELRGHSIALMDLKNNKEIVLDTVRLMSFIKFAPNCLNKMRIEDCKKLRKQMKDAIEKAKLIKARAKIKKEK